MTKNNPPQKKTSGYSFSYLHKDTPFAKAVTIVGGHSKMGLILGVHRRNVWHWVNSSKKIPLTLKQCQKIEKATQGLVTAAMLKPEFFR